MAGLQLPTTLSCPALGLTETGPPVGLCPSLASASPSAGRFLMPGAGGAPRLPAPLWGDGTGSGYQALPCHH